MPQRNFHKDKKTSASYINRLQPSAAQLPPSSHSLHQDQARYLGLVLIIDSICQHISHLLHVRTSGARKAHKLSIPPQDLYRSRKVPTMQHPRVELVDKVQPVLPIRTPGEVLTKSMLPLPGLVDGKPNSRIDGTRPNLRKFGSVTSASMSRSLGIRQRPLFVLMKPKTASSAS